MTDESTSLTWDVHVAPPEPLQVSDLASGEEAPCWSPISATLISGERDAVLGRFPIARAFALPAVVEQMRVGSTPEFFESFWKPRFDGKLPEELAFAEPLEDRAIDLEGHQLAVVELGHTDTDQTSCLHAPDIGLVVAGDAAYNEVHLAASDSQG